MRLLLRRFFGQILRFLSFQSSFKMNKKQSVNVLSNLELLAEDNLERSFLKLIAKLSF
jgi:hypothetical protein